MKLRNKKTGGLANIDGEQDFIRVYTDAGWQDYDSLAELNEEWEDCKEPLIKDDKIRKAVRAWARVNKVKEVIFDMYWHSFRDVDMVISFLVSFRDFDYLEDGKTYTIAELCGEEEE